MEEVLGTKNVREEPHPSATLTALLRASNTYGGLDSVDHFILKGSQVTNPYKGHKTREIYISTYRKPP